MGAGSTGLIMDMAVAVAAVLAVLGEAMAALTMAAPLE